MQRFLLVLPVLMLGCCVGLAQTPGPESTNNNSNQPSVNVPSTAAPAPAQTPSATKTGSPSENGMTSPAPRAGANGSPSGASPNGGEALVNSQPAQPTTEILPTAGSPGSADPLLEPKELPADPMSLIGGIVAKVDPIRNRVDLQPFGGGKRIAVRFDDRSHIYRDGRETTMMGIHKDDHIYVDTMLVDGHVFAKNLRVVTQGEAAEARGQLILADSGRNEFAVIDNLTGQRVRFQLTPRTALQRSGETTTVADLKPGAIVDIMFAPGQKGGTARQVLVLAVPGESYVFSGRVTHLDISTGMLAIDNESDEKNYTLHFDPAAVEDRDRLTVGSEVTAQATFDGRNYNAARVTLMSPASAQQ